MTIAGAGRPVWEVEEVAKERGLKLAGAAHHTDLRLAREIAHELAREGRTISADDVRAVLAERHPDIDGCMNWMGSCFRGPGWEAAGMIKSATPGRHRSRILLWRLR